MGNFQSTLNVRGAFSSSLVKAPKDTLRGVRIDLSARPATKGATQIREFFVFFVAKGCGVTPIWDGPPGTLIGTIKFPPALLLDTQVYEGEKTRVIQRDEPIGCIVDEVSNNFIKLSYDSTEELGVDHRICAWTGSKENIEMASGDIGIGFPLKIYRQQGGERMLVEPTDATSVQKRRQGVADALKNPKKVSAFVAKHLNSKSTKKPRKK